MLEVIRARIRFKHDTVNSRQWIAPIKKATLFKLRG